MKGKNAKSPKRLERIQKGWISEKRREGGSLKGGLDERIKIENNGRCPTLLFDLGLIQAPVH